MINQSLSTGLNQVSLIIDLLDDEAFIASLLFLFIMLSNLFHITYCVQTPLSLMANPSVWMHITTEVTHLPRLTQL